MNLHVLVGRSGKPRLELVAASVKEIALPHPVLLASAIRNHMCGSSSPAARCTARSTTVNAREGSAG